MLLLLLLQRAGPRARPSSSCLRGRAWLLSRGPPESQSREGLQPLPGDPPEGERLGPLG